MKTGTIIGFSGRDFISDFINLMTFGIPRWSIAHVGIVYEGMLVESRSNVGVTATNLEKRITESEGRVYAYQPSRPLYPYEVSRLDQFLFDQIGKQYDLRGALHSGGFIFAALQRCLNDEDLTTLFCSEMVAASLQQTGLLITNHASWLSPNKLCRLATRRGVYRNAMRLQ